MKPTPEQVDIFDNFLSHPVCVIEAGPGCGKTTTMARCAHSLTVPAHTIYGLAFNKAAAEDMERKFPPGTKISTFNSLGASLWGERLRFFLGPGWRKPVEKTKNRLTIAELRAAGHSITPDETDDVLALFQAAKALGWAPPSKPTPGWTPPPIEEVFAFADVQYEDNLANVLTAGMEHQIKAGFNGILDFDDQIYLWTLYGTASRPIDHLFVDEAQDLTPLQLRFIVRLKPRFLVIVGDPHQAIYAFRGAMSDSFAQIYAKWPEARVFPLQTSFRLPSRVVGLLKDHNPNLKGAKDIPGAIHDYQHSMTMAELLPTHGSKAILCRNNAPLFKAALACVSSGIAFHMKDSRYMEGLVRDIKRAVANPRNAEAERLPMIMAAYWNKSSLSEAAKAIIVDKLEALLILSERASTVKEVISAIEALQRRSNLSDRAYPVVLSTAHKAKGLEWDWVCHLDPDLIPSKFAKTPEEFRQEANIAYVLNSRTLHTLVFIRSDQLLLEGTAPARKRPATIKDLPL